MPVQVTWRVGKPNAGLRAAMQRIAYEIAVEGEYSVVEILSTPKTTTGGNPAAPHFKVNLLGRDNGHNVSHNLLIRIEHQDESGHTWRYQMNNRPANYEYTTLKAKNGPPSGSPKNKRLQREWEAAESAREAQAQSTADGWYADPWANESGVSWRLFENGAWTGQTR